MKAPKIRNPYVQHIRTKASGAHGKTKKALRRNDKIVLKRELSTMERTRDS